jgi:hypothetical protein
MRRHRIPQHILKLNHITGMAKKTITQAFAKADMNVKGQHVKVRHFYQYRS